jgi:hypothetical protein
VHDVPRKILGTFFVACGHLPPSRIAQSPPASIGQAPTGSGGSAVFIVGKNFDPKKVEREFQFSALRDPGFRVSRGSVSGRALADILAEINDLKFF